uniref:Uncharacterized protein n=1 Tax=Arundo donax TaxID=35708 RepID=A0A0A9A3F2_ARUDO
MGTPAGVDACGISFMLMMQQGNDYDVMIGS